MTTSGTDTQGVFASGIIPDFVESGGLCTLTAERDGTTLTASRTAEAATASTNCGLLRVTAEAGDWTLTLSYASSTAHGSTPDFVVSVP